ncbi:MAG: glycosyltransferase family 39 protein, partial [bacterium]
MNLEASIILTSGIILGFILRLRYLKLPLDWDHGILLYQSYWYYKTKKFVVSWSEIEREPPHPFAIGDKFMIRSQKLAHTFIYLIMYKICGHRVWAYRLFDAFYYLAITAVIFYWALILFNPFTAAAAASLFYIYSTMPFFWVADDNPEKFQLLFACAAFLFITLFLKNANIAYVIMAGVCFFICMLFKQNIGITIAAVLMYLGMSGGWNHAGIMTAVILMLYIILFASYKLRGLALSVIFGHFFINVYLLQYLFNFKREESGKLAAAKIETFKERLIPNLKNNFKEASLLWIGVIAWIIYCFKTHPSHSGFIFLMVILCSTLITFFISNKFYPYYYIPFLPLAAISTGNLFSMYIQNYGPISAQSIILFTAALVLLMQNAVRTFGFFFKRKPKQQAYYMYSNTLCNFAASEEIGKYIQQNSSEEDCIYVPELNPEIYFLSKRRCPINLIYMDATLLQLLSKDEKKETFSIIFNKLKKYQPVYIVLLKGTSIQIGMFEKAIGKKYFIEHVFMAGFNYLGKSLFIQLFRRRD